MAIRIEAKEIVLVPIGEIKLNPKNRNAHPESQVDHIATIINVAFRRPCTISNRSGLLVCGEGRYLAAKKLGWAHIPCMYQDYLSEEEEFADGIADNALDKQASLDFAGINADLADIGPFDIELLGIKDFVLEPAEKFDPQSDEDSVPENADTRVKLGDIWQLGKHRLMCGDSTNPEHVAALMDGERADMVFTDPPYGISYEQEHRKSAPKQTKTDVANYFPVIKGDEINIDHFVDTILGFFGDAKRIFIWGILNGTKLPKGSYIVWDKKTEAQANCPFGDFDVCWSKNTGWSMIRSMWGGFHSKEKGEVRHHPTQKPIDLVEQFFSKWCDGLKNVVDLFGGSGSTLIACEKTNRKCFMMELDPHYCDIILARWEQYTGKIAERLIEGDDVENS